MLQRAKRAVARVVPALRGAWSLAFAVGSQPSRVPAPIARRPWGGQIGNSRSGRKALPPEPRRPAAAKLSCFCRPRPTGVILFPSFPPAVSIHLSPLPSSTSLDTFPRQETATSDSPPIGPSSFSISSHVLCCSPVILTLPNPISSSATAIRFSEAAIITQSHLIRKTKL